MDLVSFGRCRRGRVVTFDYAHEPGPRLQVQVDVNPTDLNFVAYSAVTAVEHPFS